MDLKNVDEQATKGIHMAPNFQGILSCCQLKMVSCVLMECATEIENVRCFLPLHMLPSKKQAENGLQSRSSENGKTAVWHYGLKVQ